MAENDVTVLLAAAAGGDSHASGELFEAVHGELRRMAAAKMRSERVNHTLQPTALVNEAFVRLCGNASEFTHRAHFFGAASRAMERVLVDSARERMAQKRGGGAARVSFDEVRDGGHGDEVDGRLGVVEVHDALEQLEKEDPKLAQLVRYRFFAGMTLEEVAEVMDISVSTVRRQWTFARAWLHDRLGGEADAPTP
ncbi:MAG: sigma-70 family RNA polymerase sigma factor [Planctomycetota bacterium]